MGLFVTTNLASLIAQRNLTITNQLPKAPERLSSDLRINRAADDAAGLAIADKLRPQVLFFPLPLKFFHEMPMERDGSQSRKNVKKSGPKG